MCVGIGRPGGGRRKRRGSEKERVEGGRREEEQKGGAHRATAGDLLEVVRHNEKSDTNSARLKALNTPRHYKVTPGVT